MTTLNCGATYGVAHLTILIFHRAVECKDL